MKKFTKITSKCILLRSENIDTDQIIPAQFLKTTKRDGLGKYLFYNLRTSFSKGTRILVAGNNFGCGSSREHAVWALTDFGFRVIISSSFGDIFYNNALKNGLLPIALKNDELDKLFEILINNPNIELIVDLNSQTAEITGKNIKFYFQIDGFRKKCLIFGVDELGYILSHKDKIKAYEKKYSSTSR